MSQFKKGGGPFSLFGVLQEIVSSGGASRNMSYTGACTSELYSPDTSTESGYAALVCGRLCGPLPLPDQYIPAMPLRYK